MGLGTLLKDLGLRAEDFVQHVGVRAGTVPLQWPAGEPGSVIYRLPRDPAERASLFSKVQTIVVNDGELALVLEDGKAHGVLEPGRYVFEKARVVGSLDVIWIKTGQRTVKWGIGNVLSKDGIQLASNGVLYLKVTDGALFNAEVVQGSVTVAEMDLKRFLLPRIQGVLRKTLAAWDALDLQAERTVFEDAIRTDLAAVLATMGLTVVSLEITEINLPPEFKTAVAQGTIAAHTGRATLVDAQIRAQVIQIEAAAQAQAHLTSGIVDVELMQRLQAQGIDPLKIKALEALQTLAANPGQGGLLAGDSVRTQLIGQVALAAMTSATGGANAAAAAPPPPPAQLPAQFQDVTAEPSETAASIQRKLDQLLDRLTEGKIGEETYNKAVATLEAKLAALKQD
jgi:regulator of protease activity HflC (stomatin/prohibitin superfamily)